MFKFVKLVVKQESDICNAAYHRLSGVKEKGFFIIIILLCNSQCFEGWYMYLGKGEIALPWGFRLVWGMAILP